MGKALSYAQYFGPTVVQAAIWGLSLQKRDPFLFLVANFYTWIMYYVLVVVRDGIVRTARPFFVARCDRSFAVPDAWVVVTTSLVLTLLACALLFRKRTFWRVVTIVIIGLGAGVYIAAPLVNGYMFLWQWLVNVGIILFIVVLACVFIKLWGAPLIAWLMRWRFMKSLGFDMCFLGEWRDSEMVKRTRRALKAIGAQRSDWLRTPVPPPPSSSRREEKARNV